LRAFQDENEPVFDKKNEQRSGCRKICVDH